MKRNLWVICGGWLLALGLLGATSATAAGSGAFSLTTSSYLGGGSDGDSVVGAAILSDGAVVYAANLTAGTRIGAFKVPAGGGMTTIGCVVRMSHDGREIENIYAAAPSVHDLAIDAEDRIYVAAGDHGVLVLDGSTRKKLRQQKLGGSVKRIDAADDGHHVALVSRTGYILSPSGKPLGEAKGKSYTEDVCIDGRSKTVVVTGFRNARAWDGKNKFPVQICYAKGYAYDGQQKYNLYDWSIDRESDRFLNKPTNNMADSRGYRCSIGRDGKLYIAFEAAGGNHCFRYSPTDIMEKVDVFAGGDQYHSFHNSRSEHKTVFGRYDPATGAVERMQQFCGRLSSGRANATRMKDGQITADEMGRVYVSGAAASGLPLSWLPEGTGDYTGGAFVLVMDSEMKQRIWCTRLTPGSSTSGLAARVVDRDVHLAFGGQADADQPLYLADALQNKAQGDDGFFAVAVQEGVGKNGTASTRGVVRRPGGSPGLGGRATVTPKKPAPAEPKVDRTELLAANKLKAAKVYIDADKRDLARKILQEIVDEYGETKAAPEAKKLLETVKDKPKYFDIP